jgi:hypothetical protein
MTVGYIKIAQNMTRSPSTLTQRKDELRLKHPWHRKSLYSLF